MRVRMKTLLAWIILATTVIGIMVLIAAADPIGLVILLWAIAICWALWTI